MTSSATISDITMVLQPQPICMSPLFGSIYQQCISLLFGFLCLSFQRFFIKVACYCTNPRLKLIQTL